MRTLIFILLLPAAALGQVTSLPSMSDYNAPNPTASSGPNFNIIKSWDYTGEPLGSRTNAQMVSYYNVDVHGHSTPDGSDNMVETTLNGVTDTCLRVRNWDDGIAWPSGMYGTGGTEIQLYLDTSMREAFMDYYVKLDKDFRFEGDSKLPGFKCFKDVTGSPYPMTDSYGWLARIQGKQPGSIDTYNYDRSDGVDPWYSYGANPWAYGAEDGGVQVFAQHFAGVDYDYNNILTKGSWHKVAICLKMNSWSGSTAQRDGVQEVYIDDKFAMYMDEIRFHAVEADTNMINGISISQFENGETSGSDFYSYIDEVTIYIPTDDPKLGLVQPHDSMWESPLVVPTDDLYSDSIIDDATEDVTIVASAAWDTYAWIIDAGTGGTVTLSWNSGDLPSGCFLITFEGKKAGGDVIQKHEGAIADMSVETSSVSTGQYMYVYMVGDASSGIDLSGNVTFN